MTHRIQSIYTSRLEKSFLWLALAVGCFQAAYASIHHPAVGLLIFGYAYGWVRLTEQPSVRRAFYFGLVTAFPSYAPQLFFMWRIFGPAAIVLWLILAFGWDCSRAWSVPVAVVGARPKTAWLIPAPLDRSGVFPQRTLLPEILVAEYRIRFASSTDQCRNTTFGNLWRRPLCFLASQLCFLFKFLLRMNFLEWLLIPVTVLIIYSFLFPVAYRFAGLRSPVMAGVQMEFPAENLIPKMLDQALAKNTNADIFVLSEYTLDAGVPDALKNWCRDHQRYLVVGGKDIVTNDVYYDSAFVVGTNGEVVFKQAKSVPIQFFHDGLSATNQSLWNSPWGKIGICICYDLELHPRDRPVGGAGGWTC